MVQFTSIGVHKMYGTPSVIFSSSDNLISDSVGVERQAGQGGKHSGHSSSCFKNIIVKLAGLCSLF
jgi:hypothetical protein